MKQAAGSRDLVPALTLGLVVLASEWLPGVPGQLAQVPLLGAFPGLALAWALFPSASRTARWVIGLALAPLVSSVAGWALMAGGGDPAVAARVIGWAAWLAWVVRMSRPRRPEALLDSGLEVPGSGTVAFVGVALAVAVAVPHFVNPWMLVKSDAWNHAGIVYQILERGMPPEDPRFSGLRLNYVWFYNLYIGLQTSVHEGSAFVFMTALNVVDVALTAWLAYVLGWMLWRQREGAVGTALLTCFGFNAFMFLLWPLRGLHELASAAGHGGLPSWSVPPLRLSSWEIMNDVGAPHTWIENFIDKFVTGTSINYTWLLMMLFLWASIRLMRGRHPGAWIVVVLCSAGMQLWHGVVGLSAVPVALCAVALMLVLRRAWNWLPPSSRLVEFGAAAVLGFALVWPYTRAISSGWDPRHSGLHVSPVHLSPVATWTFATSCAFAMALALKPIRSIWSARDGVSASIVTYTLGICLFSILIALPNQNEVKFAYEAFVPLALLGGMNFSSWLGSMRSRFGRAGLALLGLLLAAPLVLTLVGFTLDRERLTYAALNPAPGENAMYDWIAAETPKQMVFVDARYRDLVMVRARRQMYLGSASGPERAAFPLAQVLERRAVMADLYGAADSLERDAGSLTALGRPACVIFRSQDGAGSAHAAAALRGRPDLFHAIYERDGFVLYAVKMPAAKSQAPTP
jgi:hypothetical protein